MLNAPLICPRFIDKTRLPGVGAVVQPTTSLYRNANGGWIRPRLILIVALVAIAVCVVLLAPQHPSQVGDDSQADTDRAHSEVRKMVSAAAGELPLD
jgi:multidrug efflux pump subunit AcrB